MKRWAMQGEQWVVRNTLPAMGVDQLVGDHPIALAPGGRGIYFDDITYEKVLYLNVSFWT